MTLGCLQVKLNLILMQYFAHVGLAMATAISAWLNVAMLSGGLIRRGHFSFDGKILVKIFKYVIASVVMGGVVWLVSGQMTEMFSGELTEKTLALLALILVGIGCYLTMIVITGAVKPQELMAVLRRKKST